jgi:hypothetical protein
MNRVAIYAGASTDRQEAESWAGLEPIGTQDESQLIDSINRQKRSNRSFRRFEGHGGYTGYEFFSRDQGRK